MEARYSGAAPEELASDTRTFIRPRAQREVPVNIRSGARDASRLRYGIASNWTRLRDRDGIIRRKG